MSKLKTFFGLLRILLPEPIVAWMYRGRRTVVAGRMIDAKAQAVSEAVAMMRDINDMPTVEESRRQLLETAQKLEKPGPNSVGMVDIQLPGADGERRARVYTPAGVSPDAAGPTLLYLHGGGWVQGAIESHDGLCARLADLAGIRVVSYDYRLAPEHMFPAAVDDVLACYRALIAGETGLQVDAAQLVVGGDSAGGNLTAVLMHDIAKAGLLMPKAQLLIYPAVDARMTAQSMQDLQDQPLLPGTRIRWYLDLYIPEGHDRLDPRISAVFTDTFAAQSPAFVVAGGHDPLWDDAHVYAEALRKAGVAVELVTYPGQIHAFMSLTKVIPQGNEAIEKTANWLQDVFKGS
ncbi:Carboxylesterase NlhH [Shimia sp. SK013]|uniref:alpha/beta hydrolase n=1 Tax=Shimia sp. SK013 TaxID=1389006 RepID=UPI0006B4D439|nr:alpha/beta hydrolase [Shimia sp. SK013]KPA21163.1 Carboxylesterase NlhH [Shimia sp. SK013]